MADAIDKLVEDNRRTVLRAFGDPAAGKGVEVDAETSRMISSAIHAFGGWLATSGIMDPDIAGGAVAAWVEHNGIYTGLIEGPPPRMIEPTFLQEAARWKEPDPEQFRRRYTEVRLLMESRGLGRRG